MHSTRKTLTILVLVAGALLAGPGSASAQVACGDTITEDTTLTEDLVCLEGDGVIGPDGIGEYSLLIGADGVTLDLNGHVVGSYASWSDPGIGVFGHSDVTIKNGRTIHVALVDTTHSRLIGVEAFWHELRRSDRNRIADSAGGISLSESDDNVMKDNRAISPEGGVSLDRSDRNVVRRNTLCGGMGDPLLVGEGSDANLIKDNVAPRCSGWEGNGFVVQEHTAGNRLIGNTVLGSPGQLLIPHGDGIRVHSSETTLVGNTANFNDDYGIEAVAGVKSGMNYARDNGNPLQCLNVKCRTAVSTPAS